MANSAFRRVPKHKFKREPFNLSHTYQSSWNAGELIPILFEETIPGDIWHGSSGIELRSMPMVSPVFTHFNVDVRFFYVPNRILWDGFPEFLMDTKSHVHPFLSQTESQDPPEFAPGSIYNYFGVPRNTNEPINALPFRAYNMIWNEYFRDQNLQSPVPVEKGDGFDDFINYDLLHVNYKKDYFTSALPWTQAGKDVSIHSLVELVDQGWDPDTIPPLPAGVGKGQFMYSAQYGPNETPIASGSYFTPLGWKGNNSDNPQMNPLDASGNIIYGSGASNSWNGQTYRTGLIDPNGTWEVRTPIRELRQSSAVQRFLERSALVGSSRYADWLRGIFGVDIGDASLQRPMYLGGGSQMLNVSAVEQSSSTDNTSPQGNLAGKGYMLAGYKFNKPVVCAEHGWIIGLAYLRPDSYYVQGLDRHMSKSNRFDYFIPGLEHIGEQEILNKEVYCIPGNKPNASSNNNGTFGYQERYAEYKWSRNLITGELLTSLKHWVTARKLGDGYPDQASPIPLNESFIECNPLLDDNFAVSADQSNQWVFNVYNYFPRVLRPLSYFPKYYLK